MKILKGDVQISKNILVLFFLCSGLVGSFVLYKCYDYRRCYMKLFRVDYLTMNAVVNQDVMIQGIEYAKTKKEGVIKEPYASITSKPNFQGFLDFQNKFHLERIIRKRHPKRIVEIGAYHGVTSIFMGIKSDADAKIYSIDPWNGKKYHNNDTEMLAETSVYGYFLANVKKFKLTDKIIPLKMKSEEAVKEFSGKADLIYVDGDHAEKEVIKDVVMWYPKLAEGGIMAGDDYSWISVQQGVQKALDILLEKKIIKERLVIHSDKNFWWFDPKVS